MRARRRVLSFAPKLSGRAAQRSRQPQQPTAITQRAQVCMNTSKPAEAVDDDDGTSPATAVAATMTAMPAKAGFRWKLAASIAVIVVGLALGLGLGLGLGLSSTSYGTSTTVYTDDPGAACGGAFLTDIYNTLDGLSLDLKWFPVAIAQNMAQPLTCDSADEATGTGSPSITGAGYQNVLHAYCAQCIQFTSDAGATAGALVMDTCPHDGNEEWCPMGGTTNTYGYYNHLDFFGPVASDVTDVIGTDNPTGTIELVACPDEIISAITELADADNAASNPVCTFYYQPGVGPWQGSPGMDVFGCSQCS